MPSLKDIRRRIGSVKNTQKITRAMKLVSAAKLRRAQEAMLMLRPYAQKHREMLSSLAAQVADGEAVHPLLERRPEVKRIGVLAMNSDRGMCGAFNAGLQKTVEKYRRERLAESNIEEVVLYPLGKRIVGHVRRSELPTGEAFGEIIPASEMERVRHITKRLVDDFKSGAVDEVVIVSNRFISALTQTPTVQPLLPVMPPEADDDVAVETATDGGDLFYEPDQVSLLQYVVPRYVEVQVRQAILESIAAEHASRMNAMSNATDNASEMIGNLTLQMNRARQAAITTELMEIIGGAEALK